MTTVICLFFFFFYVNNLLHRAHRQIMVATFVTTYKKTKLHEVKRKKREKEKAKQKDPKYK